MEKVRLGVNIDHVATLRQARGEEYPSIANAARVSLESGADQITIHLREDRRHIQDYDVLAVKTVTHNFNKPLNLEIGAASEIIDIAIETAPTWICIVPEKREERTTEGGLDLTGENLGKIQQTIDLFRQKIPETKISLFVESNPQTMLTCCDLKVDAVEIHTGDYAHAFNNGDSIEIFIKSFRESKKICNENSIGFHAGHGLTDINLVPLVEHDLFVEYNIGHWIIADSVFCGLNQSVQKLRNIIDKK